MTVCPSCKIELPDNAVLCVGCGFHLKDGMHLAMTVGEDPPASDSVSDENNPFRSPADTTGRDERKLPYQQNYDLDTRVGHLEERVRALERRVDATRLVAPGFFTRMQAVTGYTVLGFFLAVLVYSFLRALIRAIS
jgi:hypothetical protein